MKQFIILTAIAVFLLAGCGNDAPTNVIEEPVDDETVEDDEVVEPVLTEERETLIIEHMALYEGMVSIHEIGESNGTIVVWLDFGEEPMTGDAAQGITDGIAMEIAELFESELPIKITAIQLSEDGSVTEFGSSVFSPETGEVEYQS